MKTLLATPDVGLQLNLYITGYTVITESIIRLVVGTARIFTSAKQNVDCMTGKLNILKGSLVPVMHLLSQTTSRQLVTI